MDYLITKNGLYYGPNAQGYTANVAEAGRFTLEEAERRSHPNGPDGPRDGIRYEPAPEVTPKPEPTEDHLRRACEELKREADTVGGATCTVARLLAERDARSGWFAGDVDCDGNELVTIRADELQKLRDDRDKFKWQVHDTCARAEKAEAERDAMQARVERCDSSELRAATQRALLATLGDTYDCTRVWLAWGYGTMGQDDFVPVLDRLEELIDAVEFEIQGCPKAEPTPGPDHVLAREAAAHCGGCEHAFMGVQGDPTHGLCRRYPPNDEGRWPEVLSGDRCGEFRALKLKERGR